MSKLIIASNRLPVHLLKAAGKFSVEPSIGGLATGVSSIYKTYQSLWIGWPGLRSEEIRGHEAEITELLKQTHCAPIYLSRNAVELYYQGFSNETIWPLFHYFPQYTKYKGKFWNTYKRINESFADAIVAEANSDDVIWIHDYHLMLVPTLVRERRPELKVGFFLHIPFPSFEIFRLLPWRDEIIAGLLGADLIGFHTYDYVQHFLDTVEHLFGYEHPFGEITVESRHIQVDAFPMGIDYDKFALAQKERKVARERRRLQKTIGSTKLILSVDRMDYSKGILQRLQSFDLFLERHPEFLQQVTLLLLALPSRTYVHQYSELKKAVDALIGKINGKYATFEWSPIQYLYRSLEFEELAALYGLADVALVTPLRDGLNLVAKEYIASRRKGMGVLILSEVAGAVHELSESLVVNPNSQNDVADAIYDALTMPALEQKTRNTAMQERLRRNDVSKWSTHFLESLDRIVRKQRLYLGKTLTATRIEKIRQCYSSAKSRLILLDYDGTLTPFSKKPHLSAPSRALIELLERLTMDKKNVVCVISGRDRHTLQTWLSKTGCTLVAEHGAWMMPAKQKNWRAVEQFHGEWKQELRPVLDTFIDRTPGAFVEEKDFSLAWHYRNVLPGLASTRIKELKDTVMNLTAHTNIGVLDGNKVLEIKDARINKGRAAIQCLESKQWDFVLAIGDDVTDEDMFTALPESAETIVVGSHLSAAKYHVKSTDDVRVMLELLTANS